MIVTLCQQIFIPMLNKFFLMRSTTTFSGLLMELKHEKSGQYPFFCEICHNPNDHHFKKIPSYHPPHRPYTSPRSTPLSPSCSSLISSQNILFVCPNLSLQPVRAWSCQSQQLYVNKFCQYISKNKICVNYN